MKVLLFRGRGVISGLIRWQTRSQYSHAAILTGEPNIIVEAWQGDGVREKRVKDWSNIDVFEVVGITKEQERKVMEFLAFEAGKKYDYWGVIRFVSRGRMPENDRWFCSELVFAAFASVGIHLLERVEAWAVSPALLALSPLLRSKK